MKAVVITLPGDTYSEKVTKRCINSAKKVGLEVKPFAGIKKEAAQSAMALKGLKWTWAHNNTKKTICPHTGLEQFPYTAANTTLADLDSKIGCTMSHWLLWEKCYEEDETYLILEHDTVFLRPLPDINFSGICQINDPNGATWRGRHWSLQMQRRGPGVFPKTWVTKPNERKRPDGLAGNSAYLIKPWAAKELLDTTREIGIWPNDALMCKQLFSYLQEYYPFITKVQQTKSTSINR